MTVATPLKWRWFYPGDVRHASLRWYRMRAWSVIDWPHTVPTPMNALAPEPAGEDNRQHVAKARS